MAAFSLVVLIAAVVGHGTKPSIGQVVFVPVLEHAQTTPRASGLRIDSCQDAAQGLRVVGHVEEATGTVTVQVVSGDPATVGVRVGLAQAEQIESIPGAKTGDFQIVIPWADESATFLLVRNGLGRGRSIRCPLAR